MKREKLLIARSRKGWTQEEAAEHLGVSAVTVCRWEQGETTPFSYNIGKLCETYEMTAAQLGLDEDETSAERAEQTTPTAPPFLPFVREDLTLRLLALALVTCRTTWAELLSLQERVLLALKEIDTMNTDKQDYQFTRREALCRLAALPLVTLNLSALIAVTQHPAEEVLTQCTAGLTACRQLSRGWHEDMQLASQALSAYLPTLKQIVKDSPRHRNVAARLTARVAALQTTLSLHMEGPQRAADYARQAVTYSQESGDLPLQIVALRYLAWTYFRSDRPKQALATLEQATHLIQQATVPVPSSLEGASYATLAKYQAFNRLPEAADSSLHLAHDIFPVALTNEADLLYTGDMEYNYANLLLEDGMTHYYLGQHEQAMTTFARIIDAQTHTPKIEVNSKRTQVEVINHTALASLKLPMNRKDKEVSIHLLQAGVEGARSLQSEQRFAEAQRAYELMEAIWSGDSDVLELHDLFEHW
ncbi:MAG: helix-turn-helix transcriptional regulator, partial [Ktedonobacteraceae bacterium]